MSIFKLNKKIAITIIAIALLAAAAFVSPAQAAGSKSGPPNILLILVDDVGYADIGAFSARINNTTTDKLYYETPHIDKLAKQGTMFTQFYACTVCAPTRASMMTGKMNNRMGMWDAYAAVRTTFEKTGKDVPDGCHILDNNPWEEYRYNKTDRGVSIPVSATALHDVKTIPQGLTGYDTAFIGKWHMGSHNHEGYRPKDQGFDETLAYFDGGGSTYYRPFRACAALTPKWDNPGPDLTPRQDYLSDDVAQRVNRFLTERANKHSDKPFFLYFAHPAAHGPIQSRADDLAYFKEKALAPGLIGHKSPEYAGLIKGMDRSIGKVLDKLDELKLSDNTAVIFISDNGGHPKFTRNTPLRGGKSMLYEGGIRVPMIVRWPGKTKPATVCDVTSDIADIYPTIMEIAGVDYSDFKADKTTDGISLKPLFRDLENKKNSYTRDEFYHFYGKLGYGGFHNFATWATLRKGDYKLHYDYQGKVELYNIAADIIENNDLTKSKPKLAHDMLVQLTDWLKANCNENYLPKPNPEFNPAGKLPYGPYVPLEQLKASLLSEKEKPNVLLIAVDDLNDWIGCMGGHPQAKTPNMDRLAQRGVLFTNAQCQSPVCNPSRASLMTSLYPSTSGIYFLDPDPKESPVAAKSKLMPQRFVDEGYYVTGAGKLFHGRQNTKYIPNYGGGFGGVGPYPKKKISSFPGHPLWDWGVYPEKDEQMPDHKIASWAEKQLAEKKDDPLWMGVGFMRPHVPQYAPQKWFDMYPLDTLQLPKVTQNDLKDISQYGVDITRLKHVAPTHEWVTENNQWKPLVQSYLACVSFVDAQVGRVLDALDKSDYADNTYIILFTDHGFHIGEKERHAKRSLWEDGTRTPMIIAGPGIAKGKVCNKPAQLLDIYPTLLDLTGHKADPSHEGNSLVPLLKNPDADWPHMARTSFGPGNYAIVSERYRYIQYNDGSEEFYDHASDPHEWNNVIKNPQYAQIVKQHRLAVPQERYEILGKGSTGHISYDATEAAR